MRRACLLPPRPAGFLERHPESLLSPPGGPPLGSSGEERQPSPIPHGDSAGWFQGRHRILHADHQDGGTVNDPRSPGPQACAEGG